MEKLSFDVEHLTRVRALSHLKSSLKRSTRSSISKSTSTSRVSPDGPDASRGKRVRFVGPASICEQEGKLDGSLLHHEVDGAKTSEFKSFKRLLEKTALNHYLDKVSTSDLNLKKGIARNCKEASSNPIRSKSAVRRSSLPIQNVFSVAQYSLCSPAQLSQKDADKTWSNHTADSTLL